LPKISQNIAKNNGLIWSRAIAPFIGLIYWFLLSFREFLEFSVSANARAIEFIDPWGGVFAYVGRRTTGTQAGEYLISGPGWQGTLPEGVTQIVTTDNAVLLVGRMLVESDSDLLTAYGLSKQIQLTPLSSGD
jgi:hypothetical protein